MKFLDNNGRLFGKISIIDVLIILVFAVMLIGLAIRDTALEVTATNNNPDVTFTYKLKISNCLDLLVDDFQVGDDLYIESSGNHYGKIIDVEYEPATVWNAMSDGVYRETTSLDRYDVYLTIETTGTVSGDRYMINRVDEIEPNYQAYFYTKYVSFFAYVMEIG